MNIDIKDTVTLSDDNSYVVVSKVIYEGSTYYYLLDRNNQENIKFCVENTINSSFLEVDNTDLIQRLLPLFVESSTKAITEEDLELLANANDE